jgi:protein SCO1/2
VRRALLLLPLALLAGCGGKSAAPSFRGTVLSPPPVAPKFTLVDDAGRPVSLSADRGRYVVVTFLYTHCPDVCPVIAGNLNRVLATPTARQARLRVIAVSVDPKRDTPAAVRRYVAVHRLRPAFSYLIGDQARLSRVWRAYHVAATPLHGGTIAHSTFEILVDPKGRERVVYDAGAKPADFVHDLALLEQQT